LTCGQWTKEQGVLSQISRPISAIVATAVVVVLVAILYPRAEGPSPSNIEPMAGQAETSNPAPTDFPTPEGFIDPDMPPLPATWNEGSAVAYTEAWLAWQIPGFAWANADARRASNYVLSALFYGVDINALPTLSPSAPNSAGLEQEFWLVVFSLDAPMSEGAVSAALWTAMGIDEGMIEDRLFTRGYAKLVESGNFTSFGIFDYIDEAGQPAPIRQLGGMPSSEAILSLPTQVP
jgi:hypothetical protein